jgi:AraC-like DNA-binding protein
MHSKPAVTPRRARGEALPQAVLTEELVRQVRRLHRRKQALIERLNTKYSAAALARRAGCSTRAIQKVLARQTWAHIKDEA